MISEWDNILVAYMPRKITYSSKGNGLDRFNYEFAVCGDIGFPCWAGIR